MAIPDDRILLLNIERRVETLEDERAPGNNDVEDSLNDLDAGYTDLRSETHDLYERLAEATDLITSMTEAHAKACDRIAVLEGQMNAIISTAERSTFRLERVVKYLRGEVGVRLV